MWVRNTPSPDSLWASVSSLGLSLNVNRQGEATGYGLDSLSNKYLRVKYKGNVVQVAVIDSLQ